MLLHLFPGEEVNWVQCDRCEQWFHLLCVGLGEDEVSENEDYVCFNCKVGRASPPIMPKKEEVKDEAMDTSDTNQNTMSLLDPSIIDKVKEELMEVGQQSTSGNPPPQPEVDVKEEADEDEAACLVIPSPQPPTQTKDKVEELVVEEIIEEDVEEVEEEEEDPEDVEDDSKMNVEDGDGDGDGDGDDDDDDLAIVDYSPPTVAQAAPVSQLLKPEEGDEYS